MAGCILAAALMAACVLTAVLCRRYVARAYDAVDEALERALAWEGCPPVETTRETRLAKLTHKARRVVNMRAAEAERSKEERETIQGFISDMSHQMKTPLSGIAMYADLLLGGNLSAGEQHEFITRIKGGTDKLQWMMDSLIMVSRLETGAIQLAPVHEGIKRTVSEAIGGVIAAASKKNIDITVTGFEDAALYHDRRWTREAIANVLENAIKYSPPGSKIRVSAERLPLFMKITVIDNGAGVQPGERHLIFKRFYRGQNARDVEGTGLGLYLAALIVEKQGGYIMVDSELGVYTSFSLFLPNTV